MHTGLARPQDTPSYCHERVIPWPSNEADLFLPAPLPHLPAHTPQPQALAPVFSWLKLPWRLAMWPPFPILFHALPYLDSNCYQVVTGAIGMLHGCTVCMPPHITATMTLVMLPPPPHKVTGWQAGSVGLWHVQKGQPFPFQGRQGTLLPFLLHPNREGDPSKHGS